MDTWSSRVFERLGRAYVAITIFAFLWMNISGGALQALVFVLLTALICVIAQRKGDSIAGPIYRAKRLLPDWPITVWFLSILILGTVLRAAVIIALPVTPTSEATTYLRLASELAAGTPYSTPEGRAYWPPGLPLVLAPLLRSVGTLTPIVYGLGTFILAAVATLALGRRLAGPGVACLAAFIVAVWPNSVFAASLVPAASLLMCLWPTAAYLYLKAIDSNSAGGRYAYALAAGLAFGYADLTQPLCILLPLCPAFYDFVTTGLSRIALLRLLAVMVGAIAIVVPWLARDYRVLHEFIPITTGIGVNFFMVSVPSSDGKWSPPGEQAALKLSDDEVVRNKLGFSSGIEAIRNNITTSAASVAKKSLYLFGQDIASVYWVLGRFTSSSDKTYGLFFWISQIFYCTIITMMTIFFFATGERRRRTTIFLLPLLFTVYPIFAHSLFEASEQDRVGVLVFMALFAAMSVGDHEQLDSGSNGEVRRIRTAWRQ